MDGSDFLNKNPNVVFSEVYRIEFTERSIRISPISVDRLKDVIIFKPVPQLFRLIEDQNITVTEISYESIIGYKSDPGFPICGKPVVALFFLHNNYSEKKTIGFTPYAIIPSNSFFHLKALLKKYEIVDQSCTINSYIRLTTWLIVPAFLLLGFYLAKSFSGFPGLFGAVSFITGIFMLIKTIAELMMRAIQLARQKYEH